MTTLQFKRGTAARWTLVNPVLAMGEPGFETDTGKEKIGDGTTAWVALPYQGGTIGAALPLTTTAVKTGTYTAAANELLPCDATSAPFTVTLPTAPADKTRVIVKKVDLGANTVTVACGGTAVFNRAGGSTTFVMSLPGQAATLQYATSGGLWYVTADDLPLPQLDTRFVSVTPPPSGNATTDTALIQGRIDTFAASGGGVLTLQKGTYVVTSLQIKTGVYVRGEGTGATIIQLASGTNADLITVPNFATLTGGNTSGGESAFAFANLTLDGNGSAQTGTSWTFRVYGCNYRMTDIAIINGRSGNVFSEWGNNPGGDMEAYWHNFKVRTPTGSGATNVDWRGPHDSIFNEGVIVAGVSGLLQTGLKVSGNAAGDVFTSVHVWGYHQNGWIQDVACLATGCQSEGAQAVNLLVRHGRVRWSGKVYGTNDTHTGEIGVQIGDATHTGIAGVSLDVDLFQFGVTSYALNFVSTSGENRVTGRWFKGTSTALYQNAPALRDEIDVICPDVPASTVHEIGHRTTFDSFDGSFLVKIGGSATFEIPSTALISLYHGLLLRGWTGLSGSTNTWQLDASNGAIQPGTATGLGGRVFSGAGAPTFSATAGDTYIRTDTPGTPAQRLYICTGTTNWTPYDSRPADIQVFTGNGTYTKPAGAKTVQLSLIGGGSGGGSGARGAAGTARCGGGGGGGGGMTLRTLDASVLGSTEAVTVGTGGAGGAAQTTDTTAGTAGTAGTGSAVGSHARTSSSGAGGGGGIAVAGSAGGAGNGTSVGGGGVASSATGAAGSAGGQNQAASGGGSGGGITTGDVVSGGGAGSGSTSNSYGGGSAGTSAGGAGGNGTAAPANSANTGGSGGGGGSSTGAGGTGGNGAIYGAGGGGGGASLNGSNSGAGGNGAAGVVIITTYF